MKNMFKRILVITAVVLTVATVLFFWVCSWTYSEGSRAGQLIKISRKGVIFKTHEGQLNTGGFQMAEGIQGNIWEFSVTDENVLKQFDDLEGKKVKIYYKERYKSMPWVGKTNYIVKSIKPVE
jgi:hypothetical protein